MPTACGRKIMLTRGYPRYPHQMTLLPSPQHNSQRNIFAPPPGTIGRIEPDHEAASRSVPKITNAPLMAFTPAAGQVVAANVLGTQCQGGGDRGSVRHDGLSFRKARRLDDGIRPSATVP